jgi:hypothetical protein
MADPVQAQFLSFVSPAPGLKKRDKKVCAKDFKLTVKYRNTKISCWPTSSYGLDQAEPLFLA